MLHFVDHLVYAAADLEAGMREIERLLGVAAVTGGQHSGRGTRNALRALGDSVYLEIVAPDPSQPAPESGRWLGVDACVRSEMPRLTTWAAKCQDLFETQRRAVDGDLKLGPVREGRRTTPDGTLLRWELTDPEPLVSDGVVPFLIDWGASRHPAKDAPRGARLVNLRLEHPDAATITNQLRALPFGVEVHPGTAPALIAVITGPRGTVELR